MQNVLHVRSTMLCSTMPSMHQVYRPCMTFAPRRPMRTRRQAFSSGCPFDSRSTQCRSLRSMSVDTQQVRPQHTQLHAANNKPWPCIGILAPALAAAGPSRAGEVSEAATDVATATAAATADLPPTVTFGGSFGQYDPIIAVFFYAVVAALLVLTLGVTYLSIRNWQDSTDEKKERAAFSRSSQNRESAELSGRLRSKRQPPKSKASKGSSKGFGS